MGGVQSIQSIVMSVSVCLFVLHILKPTTSQLHQFFLCMLHAFSALTLLVGWQEGHLACKKTEWWDTGMVMCLGQGADLHMAQLMPLWFYLSGAGSPR